MILKVVRCFIDLITFAGVSSVVGHVDCTLVMPFQWACMDVLEEWRVNCFDI